MRRCRKDWVPDDCAGKCVWLYQPYDTEGKVFSEKVSWDTCAKYAMMAENKWVYFNCSPMKSKKK
jgi:hypothetical protein